MEDTSITLDVQMITQAIIDGNWPVIIMVLGPIIVVIANVITAMTPTKYDNQLGNILSKVLNVLSFNFGWNSNADDPDARDKYTSSRLPY